MSEKSKNHFLGGALSGLLSCIILQPLDLRLQQELSLKRHSTMYSTLVKIIKQDSMLGLWRGTVPTILRNVPGSGLYFYSLYLLRNQMNSWKIMNQNVVHLSGGILARVSVGFVMMPITVVKIRYESSIYSYKSISNAFYSIVKQEGVRGLFAGFGATAMRDAPFAGIYVFFYENLKPYCRKVTNETLAVNMASGLIGGSLATLLTQPFDMMKTRLQLKPKEYRNMVFAFTKILREERVTGFFSGMIPRIMRKSLSSAISWSVYEEVVKRLL